ncbi:hypothetical protein F7725_011753 [Dissostichus mawsoni]|uniref:Uncharacterized protein n=1 Tax=Dissostichus mawsoni TaxID=36200 RepID=A0A7J5Z9R1_DISMA|nr:hypothetical protein F7725_011753 [Dissostichus mawsoni]
MVEAQCEEEEVKDEDIKAPLELIMKSCDGQRLAAGQQTVSDDKRQGRALRRKMLTRIMKLRKHLQAQAHHQMMMSLKKSK